MTRRCGTEAARAVLLAALIGASSMAVGAGDPSPATPAPAAGTIRGSVHDFSSAADSPLAEICLPCHLPQREVPPDAGPLWDDRPQARQPLGLYQSGQGAPGPASLVCLSCHDGSTAPDVYGGMRVDVVTIAGAGRDPPARGKLRREALRRDHPVGVGLPADTARFRPRSQIESEGFVVLPQGRVECLSCHDVHNQYGGERLLVRRLEDGLLCLTCHRK